MQAVWLRYPDSDGNLSKKIKELIAVGISVVSNCESCMEWHIKEAARSCATIEEVLEAVEVGMEMGGGLATTYASFTVKGLILEVWPHWAQMLSRPREDSAMRFIFRQ